MYDHVRNVPALRQYFICKHVLHAGSHTRRWSCYMRIIKLRLTVSDNEPGIEHTYMGKVYYYTTNVCIVMLHRVVYGPY